jgi:deoxyribose-phosphate aldolase
MLKKGFTMIHSIAHYLDNARHDADTTLIHVQQLCTETLQYGFNSVFINPCYIVQTKDLLQGKHHVGTVISFPLGQDNHAIKLQAIEDALAAGADELDISLNVGVIKEHKWELVYHEMDALVKKVKGVNPKKVIKCIPENGYLTAQEIQKVAELMVKAGVDFYKTCSGYGPRGATLEDVRLIREAVGDAIKIKVAGGIKTYEQAISFLDAGADRIGTSHAVQIVQELPHA